MKQTVQYYSHMNKYVQQRLGGFHSAPILLNSIDFARFEKQTRTKDWEAAARMFGEAAKDLVSVGAKAIVLCNNTGHVVAKEIEKAAGVPFIHIVHATAEKIKEQGLTKVILLGTMATMEGTFYQEGLKQHGIKVVVPDRAERDEINRVIYEELVQEVIKPSSRDAYVAIVRELAEKEGATGVIGGCTEIGLLIADKDVKMPVFDTCKIHAEKAVDWAIANAVSVGASGTSRLQGAVVIN